MKNLSFSSFVELLSTISKVADTSKQFSVNLDFQDLEDAENFADMEGSTADGSNVVLTFDTIGSAIAFFDDEDNVCSFTHVYNVRFSII